MRLNLPWVSAEEWARATDPDMPPHEAIASPCWRIANLYDIRTDDGSRIPFVPSPEQRVIIWDIVVRGFHSLVIPKARKIGLSTVLCIIAADMITFNAGIEAALVDKTREDAEDKLSRIVRFAIESLPPEIRAELVFQQDNQGTISLRSSGEGEDVLSLFSAGVSFRGGTPQFLLVSEWAAVQFSNPSRSEEIKTGAMEAARRGIRVIESSWKGGRGGHVWSYVEMAMETPEEEKTPQDWRLRFFPWWVDKRNTRDGDVGRIDAETARYLDEKQQELDIIFSPGQRLWYYHAKRELGIFIKRENPTTLDECWSAPVEGAIYADLMERLRVEGRICPIEINVGIEVDTFWDLGSPENTCVWYVQRLGGGNYDVIDCDSGLNLTTPERVAHMQRKGYSYGSHYIPHDGAADQKGGISYQDELMSAGLVNVRVIPRTSNVELGINATRNLLPRCRFNSRLCAKGIEALSDYHAKIEQGQTYRSENIVHNWSSHPSDAFRYIAESEASGMLSGQGGRRFDVAGLKAMDNKASLKTVQTGNIVVMERGAMFVREEAEASWLAMVERPQPGKCHLVAYASLNARHVWCVLRAEFNDDDMQPSGLAVLAASNGVGIMDPDIAAERVAATSQFFGECIVVPISDDTEGTWRALSAAGQVRVLKRPKSIITKSAQQIGWAGNEDITEPLAALAKRVREEHMECFHAPAREQLAAFMRQRTGAETAMAGYSDEWVKALAVGCQCVNLATPFNPVATRRARLEEFGIEPVAMLRRSSL